MLSPSLGLSVRPQGRSPQRARPRRKIRSSRRPARIPRSAQQNPLGKIPALVLDDGSALLFNSRVILEYLDHRAGGGKIIPTDAAARFAALRLQALADGIMDASILLVYEGRWRPAEKHEPKWLDLPGRQGRPRARGARSRAAGARCAARCRPDRARLRARLSRLSLRRAPGARIIPRLVGWLDDFAARVPAFDATKPPPAMSQR